MLAKKLKFDADCKAGLIDDTTAFEEFDLSTLKTSMSDDNEEGNEDYVDNESLEMDESYDNTENNTIIYDENSDSCILRVEEEQEIDDTNESIDTNDNENLDVSIAKMKRELQTDALAQAMAHVHGEYSDDNNEEQEQDNDEIDNIDDVNSQAVDENTEETMPDENINTTIMDVDVVADENDKKSIEIKKSPIKTVVKEIKSPVKNKNDTTGDEKNSKGNQVAYALNAEDFARIKKAGITSSRQLLTLGNGQILRLASRQATIGGQYALKKAPVDISSLLTNTTTKQLRQIAPKNDNKITISPVTRSSSRKVILQTNLNNKCNLQTKISSPVITTLVTDTANGTPLAGLIVSLYKQSDGQWVFENER